MIEFILNNRFLNLGEELFSDPKTARFQFTVWANIIQSAFDSWLHETKDFKRYAGTSYDGYLTIKNMYDFVNWYNENSEIQMKLKAGVLSYNSLQNENPKEHKFPTIRKGLDTDWIYTTFVNVAFKGTKDCFDAWLVNGKEHNNTLEWILPYRVGKPNYAQLRRFINKITDSDTCKDKYYKTVWGIEIKTAGTNASGTWDERLKELGKSIDKLNQNIKK